MGPGPLWGTLTTAPARLPAPSPPRPLLEPAGWGQGEPRLTCLTGGPTEAIWALAAEAVSTVCAGPAVLARARRTLVHTCRWGGGGASVEDGRLGGSATPGARGRQASRMPPGCSAARGRCSTHPRLAVRASGTHWCPAHAAPTTGTGTLDFGPSGPGCSHSVAEPSSDSPRWHCLPVKPARQAQVYEGLPGTQSSMHEPPLRHGRRARHTEAADTGPSRASAPALPDPKAVPEAWPAAHGRPGGQAFALRSARECRCDRGPPSARAWTLCRDSGGGSWGRLPRIPHAHSSFLSRNAPTSQLILGAEKTGPEDAQQHSDATRVDKGDPTWTRKQRGP